MNPFHQPREWVRLCVHAPKLKEITSILFQTTCKKKKRCNFFKNLNNVFVISCDNKVIHKVMQTGHGKHQFHENWTCNLKLGMKNEEGFSMGYETRFWTQNGAQTVSSCVCFHWKKYYEQTSCTFGQTCMSFFCFITIVNLLDCWAYSCDCWFVYV